MRKAKAPVIPEKDVSRLIVDWFATIGVKLHRRNTGAAKFGRHYVRFNTAGMCDLWGIQSETGRHIEIEIKRKGKVPDEAQNAWIAQCADLGAIAFWADSLEMAQEKWKLHLLRIRIGFDALYRERRPYNRLQCVD